MTRSACRSPLSRCQHARASERRWPANACGGTRDSVLRSQEARGKESRMRQVAFSVNGARHDLELEPRDLLVYVLRERLGLTGTNVGCDTSSCGACTVLVNGESVKSCTMLGVQADGMETPTIEGLARTGRLHPLPQAFTDQHALQCGYCTPGMVLAAVSLID